jgi:hypothetical protein
LPAITSAKPEPAFRIFSASRFLPLEITATAEVPKLVAAGIARRRLGLLTSARLGRWLHWLVWT